MDETNWRVEDNVLLTWKMRGEEAIDVQTTGTKQRFTLILTINSSGDMLDPIIIGKGKRASTLNKFQLPSYVKGYLSKSGWVNEEIMKRVIDNIYSKTQGKGSCLVLDQYSAHFEESVKKYALEKNVTLIPVPVGLTYKRQPLDVDIHGIIKSKARTLWKKQRLMDINLKPTFANSVIRLIISLSYLTKENIKKSFQKACFTIT